MPGARKGHRSLPSATATDSLVDSIGDNEASCAEVSERLRVISGRSKRLESVVWSRRVVFECTNVRSSGGHERTSVKVLVSLPLTCAAADPNPGHRL